MLDCSCGPCTAWRAITNSSNAASGGGLIGFGFGFVTRLLLRGMQRWGASAEQQIALTVAGGYLVFYTANSPADVSGAGNCLQNLKPMQVPGCTASGQCLLCHGGNCLPSGSAIAD